MKNMTIAEKLKTLPEKSGVYLMYDRAGEVIYVGKAVVLKNRVRQYFTNAQKLPKVRAMVENVADFGYIITLSEKDAFSLEANLVKKYNPRYNILLKDDKASPYIRIDMREDYPTIEITRKIKRDGAKYFGPYLSGLRVRDIVDIIKSAYKMRACAKRFPKRECLNYHIGLCLAPCVGRVSVEEYKAVCKRVMEFLGGRDDEAQRLLEARMTDASENEDFERAISCREQLNMLRLLKERNVADIASGEDIDSIAYVSDGLYGAVSVNIIRGGKMMGVKSFALSDAGLSEDDSLTSFALQYYAVNEIPTQLCFNLDFDFEPLKQYLSSQRAISISFPRIGAKKRLVDMAEQNARDYLINAVEKLRREQDLTVFACERLSKLLGVESARRIECYDISNIGGRDNVASRAVFINGSPLKSEYRRYKIRSVEGCADDFLSMSEVIRRRFSPDNSDDMPDIVLIDGGKGQLNAAYEVIRELRVDVTLISLAKRDELIYCVNKAEPIALTKSDYALRLLQRVRDEAHRFAVGYHRTLRQSRYSSELMRIGGIGERKREKLLKSLTFKEIRTFGAEEIVRRAGVDMKTAQNIERHFKDN